MASRRPAVYSYDNAYYNYIYVDTPDEFLQFKEKYSNFRVEGIRYKKSKSQLIIDCDYDDIKLLYIPETKITPIINKLPTNLKVLHCGDCNLQTLPILPDSIVYMVVSNNFLSEIYFPDNLLKCNAYLNKLVSIPDMPDSVYEGFFGWNNIKYLSYNNFEIIKRKIEKKCGLFDFFNNPILNGNNHIKDIMDF